LANLSKPLEAATIMERENTMNTTPLITNQKTMKHRQEEHRVEHPQMEDEGMELPVALVVTTVEPSTSQVKRYLHQRRRLNVRLVHHQLRLLPQPDQLHLQRR